MQEWGVNVAQVPVYQQNRVSPDVMPAPLVSPSLPTGASGEATAKALGAAGDVLSALAIKQKETEDFNTVSTISNKIQENATSFFNGPDGLFSQKGNNAKGVTEKAQQWFKDQSEQAATQLTDNRQKTAFAKYMAPFSATYTKAIATHESNELTSSAIENIHSSYSIKQQQMSANYKNLDIINGTIEDITKQTSVEANLNGWNADTTAINASKQITLGLKGAILSSMDNKDTVSATRLLDVYKDKIDPATYNDLKAIVNKVSDKNDMYSMVKSIAASATRADGEIDVEKASQLLEAKFGPGVKKAGTVDYSTFKTNLFGQESGGNYDATNPDTGAIGKYQILPENWPKWAKDAGLPSDAKPTPENQEIVADAKLRPLYEKYGAQGAAAAWYAGEQNGQRWAEGAPDAIDGNGNHYSWDAPQGDNGEYSSIRQYVTNITGGADNGRPFNVEDLENAKTYLTQLVSENKQINAQRTADFSDTLLKAYEGGERDPQVFINMAQKAAGGDYKKLETLMTVVSNITKISTIGARTKSDVDTMLYFNRVLANASVDDVSTIRANLYSQASNLTQTDLIAFDKELNNVATGKDDKAGAIADANWKQTIDNKNDQANILSVLNNEGVHGSDRYKRAMEIYDAGKANDRGIRDYAKTNNQERESIVNAWGDSGEKLISLAEAGFRQGYTVDGQPFKWNGDYRPINTFISDIGTAMKTDPIAEQSLDYLLSNNIPLNPQNYSIVYNKLSEE